MAKMTKNERKTRYIRLKGKKGAKPRFSVKRCLDFTPSIDLGFYYSLGFIQV